MSSTESGQGPLEAVTSGTAPAKPRRPSVAREVPHLSVAERAARGRAARAEVPRSSHAVFEPAARRPDPVALLESQAASRVPELVPVRYGRMLVSPFTFYRGAALIMASDLAATPHSGLRVQLCGDAHLSNFGLFAAPDRRMVFDLNGFDETLPGPWEWDVKRLAASFAVAGREIGYPAKQRSEIVRETVRGHREAMRGRTYVVPAAGRRRRWFASPAKQRLPKRAAEEDVAPLVRVARDDVACGRVERDEATVGADAGTDAHLAELVSTRRDTETRCGGAEHVMEEDIGSLVGVAGNEVGCGRLERDQHAVVGDPGMAGDVAWGSGG